MAENYEVKQGDCISSIAYDYGFFPETIWNHPSNAELKKKRKDLNVLMPGDVVFIPDKRVKEIDKSTNQVHKFQVKNAPAKLNLVLKYYGEPIKNESYKLDLDGLITTGKTDGEGKINISISPSVKQGKLTVGEGDKEIEYNLFLGRLDPIDEIKGFKKRLQNLGYEVGNIDNKMCDALKTAIKMFEAQYELETTGEINETNRNKLKEVYGR